LKKKKRGRGREDSNLLDKQQSKSHQIASFQVNHLAERTAWSVLFPVAVVHISHSVRLLMVNLLESQFPGW